LFSFRDYGIFSTLIYEKLKTVQGSYYNDYRRELAPGRGPWFVCPCLSQYTSHRPSTWPYASSTSTFQQPWRIVVL